MGLVVQVLRRAERMGFVEIERKIIEVSSYHLVLATEASLRPRKKIFSQCERLVVFNVSSRE